MNVRGQMNNSFLEDSKVDKITERIIGCAYKVSNTLGIGFVEKIYENALAHQMIKDGLKVVQQHPINVVYDGIIVGEFFKESKNTITL